LGRAEAPTEGGGDNMANAIEIRERHKSHLYSLLKIKKANRGIAVKELDEELNAAVAVMEQEDVAYVEKLIGEKSI
jgi:hypothetical protein